MKFSTPARGAILLVVGGVIVKVILMAIDHSGARNGLLTAVAISAFYIGKHFLGERVPQRETLEIGRRGFQITRPGAVPFALAWKMIRSAALIPGASAEWRFDLKNGGQVALRGAEFSREQWKQISAQLERKFKARKIPVTVGASGGSPPARRESRPLDAEVLGEIRDCVREACYTEQRLIAIFVEEKYPPGELDPAEVQKAVRQAIAALKEEQKSWPAETDNDRLSRSFKTLEARGILALENIGWDIGDGVDAIHEAHEKSGSPQRISGYCFYTHQDQEGAVQGHPLHLAFGPLDSDRVEQDGPGIGKVIVEELERNGFKVTWNGTIRERMKIENLLWRKRI